MKWLLLLSCLAQVSSHIIKGISIYGLETESRDFVCSWKHPVDYYIDQVKNLGFNTLRLPFSYQYVQENNFQKMDQFMWVANDRNMSIILDFHRVWSSHQGPDPFEGGVTMDQFVQCWLTVLYRYSEYPCLQHINSFNEYQGTDAEFVNNYSRILFTNIEYYFPERFNYWITGTRWASDLRGINIEDVPFNDRVGYSCHKYPFSGTADEKDWDATIPSNDTEKLVIGEWGWMEDKPEQVTWAKKFIKYLRKRGIQHSCYWTIARSHDTGNLWQDDCEYIKWGNFELLKTLWD